MWVLLGLVACRATPGEPATDDTAGRWVDGELLASTDGAFQESRIPCPRLGRSLSRVREHFEAGHGQPRLVALLDHRQHGVEAVRRLISDAGDLRVTLVWDEEPRDAAWAATLPRDGRVAAFVDRRRVAGRVFARGLLPTARAREVYLVYGPEARWPAGPADPVSWSSSAACDELPPPRPLRWWHRMGRLAPAHHVADLEELGERLAEAILSRPDAR